MRRFEKVEKIEYDFVRETFYLDWPVTVIAERLDRPIATIDAIIKVLALKRPNHDVKTPKHDWPSIWYAHQGNQSYNETGRALGIQGQIVAYAIKAMILMGTEQRLVRWNKYALKHGRDAYTFEDANGSILFSY